MAGKKILTIRKLIYGYKKKLLAFNIPINAIYLYGSYSKGSAGKDSDVDICVVSPDFKDRIESTMYLMKIRNDKELIISPIAFSPKTFTNENPLAWEIKKTGILL